MDLPFPEQGVRAHITNGNGKGFSDHNADSESETLCLLQPRVRVVIPAVRLDIGTHDKRPRTAGNFAFNIVVNYQSLSPSSSSRSSSVRSTGLSGWIVDTACL